MTWIGLFKVKRASIMIRSTICEMLGIEYPVFQGGMAWIADGKLAAAVSCGGGLGIIAAGKAIMSDSRSRLPGVLLINLLALILCCLVPLRMR